jgi:ribonucleoside-diphosphate reductase alpha chain
MKELGLSDFSQYIAKSRYARWVPELSRRENWDETVSRYMKFFSPRIPKADREDITKELEKAIISFDVMPSMRAIGNAGESLERDHCKGYNCAFQIIDDPRAFDEALYILMCGTGIGFSVERQFICKMPYIAEDFYPTETTIKVSDTTIGWCTSFRQLISLLYGGLIPKYDLNLIRPAGTLLKIGGGRASGPEQLEKLFRFTIELFKNAAGRKLNSIECHDLMCAIADIVEVGGVRRAAMISLSNFSDERMRQAKNGQWWVENNPRRLANNSVAYTETPDVESFLKEWATLVESKSGERGVYNREGTRKHIQKFGRRETKIGDEPIEFGLNPCGEINLRSNQFCNLSEVVIRPEDDRKSLKKKVRLATIIGCLQSTLTDFRYLRKIWKKNSDEERLLGVSLTGIMDCPLTYTNGPELEKLLDELREYSVEIATEWAEKLGINVPTAITCIKPSGTVGSLVNSSPGIHTRWSAYLIRSVREDNKSPIVPFLKAQGVYNEPDNSRPNDSTIFFWPLGSPKNARTRHDLGAIEQLELYLTYKRHWTEHNPSCTVYVKESEWIDVCAWVYRNFSDIGGIAFLPASNHIYAQAPYQEVTKEKFDEFQKSAPKIDWDKLAEFELEDMTDIMKEKACHAGQCDL